MNEMKFCKDCKWYRLSGMGESNCDSPEAISPIVCLVTGKQSRLAGFCFDFRSGEWACGKEGKWWRQKHD